MALGGQWDEVCNDQGLEGWEGLERDTREKGCGQRVQNTTLVASMALRGTVNKSACGKGVREGEGGRWQRQSSKGLREKARVWGQQRAGGPRPDDVHYRYLI